MKSASLQVGIDQYPDPAARLNGCVNDVANVSQFLSDNRKLRFTQSYQLLNEHATKANITNAVRWLINTQADVMLCQFSGHGTQEPDRNGDESDRMDEAIVPVDYLTGGIISDDWLAKEFAKVRAGRKLIVWFDSCHSGTATRTLVNAFTPQIVKDNFKLARPRYLPPARIPALRVAMQGQRGLFFFNRPPQGVVYGNENVVALMAAKDHQTASDAWIESRQQYCGAATHYILEAASQLNPRASFEEVAALAAKKIKSARYTQDIQFTGKKAALKQPFF